MIDGRRMLVRRVRLNNRYVRTKWGRGIFSSFANILKSTARKIRQSGGVRKALDTAISAGKIGTKVIKSVAKNPEVQRTINSIIESGTEKAVDHLINKVGEKLPVSGELVDQVGSFAKNVVKDKAKEITNQLLHHEETGKKRKATPAKSVLIRKKSHPDFGDEELNALINSTKPKKKKKKKK